jgi:AbrB family looped-hinge helix DNA binding protein
MYYDVKKYISKESIMAKNKDAAIKDGVRYKAKTGRFIAVNPGSRSHTTKVTSKGQITVPKPIREHLNLTKGDRIEFLIGVNGKVTIMPATADVRQLKGMVAKPAKTVTVADMNKAIEAEGGAIK